MWQEHLPEKKKRKKFQIKSANTICASRDNDRDAYAENKKCLHSVYIFLALNFKCNITVSGQVDVMLLFYPRMEITDKRYLPTRTPIPVDNSPRS
jgi:hypothetical protein